MIVLIALIIIVVVGFFAFNNYIYQQKQGPQDISTKTTMQNTDSLSVTPISHASFVLSLSGQIIYNDPVGGKELYAQSPEPGIILVSDIHGDHFDADTIVQLMTERTVLMVPQAVKDMLPANLPGTTFVLSNDQTTVQKGITIAAIPMYNLPEATDARHTKGRGNGYVLESDGKRVYIAGDTDGISEMTSLQNIDVAFIPMNPPYTMTVEEAADAVVKFKPTTVHPYHYRTPEGLSDVASFKSLVEGMDPSIKVELLNFYP